MLNVFQLADNDQSINYLGQIFGNVGIALAGTGPALLPMMFKTFNTIMLVVGCLFVAYITIMGVMNTAQEGEFLGKKWNKLWTPIRTILGIVALFPTKAGYCIMQVVIMWVVVQGVGAADTVWKTTVDYFLAGGRQKNPPPPSDFASKIPDTVKTLFANLTCQAATYKQVLNDKTAIARSKPVLTSPSDPNSIIGYDFGFPNGKLPNISGKEAVCGNIRWEGATKAGMKEGIASTMQTLIPVLEVLANEYVNKGIEDTKCWVPCEKTQSGAPAGECIFNNKYKSQHNPAPADCILADNSKGFQAVLSYGGSNFVREAILLMTGYANNYATVDAKKNLKNVGDTNITESPNEALKRAQANGWIFAGAFYYYLAEQTGQTLQGFNEFLTAIQFKAPNLNDLAWGGATIFYCGGVTNASGNPECTKVGALGVADAAIKAQADAVSAGGGFDLPDNPGIGRTGGVGGGGMEKVSSLGSEMLRLFVRDLTNPDQQNPVVGVAAYGKKCLIAAEVLWWVYVVASLGLAFASTQILVWGYTVNFWAGVFSQLGILLMMTMAFVMGFLFVIGGLLGVYVPLIPYIIFTFGAVGWFITVIEAMIAGPIIALGILSPGGQHELLGKAEPAAGMLLSLFLRPTLMIFGMISAMLLSWVVVKFINAGFLPVVASIGGGGILSGFLFIMAYAGLIITALNKCFALIHLVPDKTLGWIGVRGESHGEEQSAQAVKGDVSAGSGAAKASGASAAGETGSQARGMRKVKEAGGVGVEGKKP